jgi:hypothetical protein
MVYHEAGHVIVGLRLGIRITSVSARDRNGGGTTDWDAHANPQPSHVVAMLLAGSAAQIRVDDIGTPEERKRRARDESRADEPDIIDYLTHISRRDPANARADLQGCVEAMLDDPDIWTAVALTANALAQRPFMVEGELQTLLRSHLDWWSEINAHHEAGHGILGHVLRLTDISIKLTPPEINYDRGGIDAELSRNVGNIPAATRRRWEAMLKMGFGGGLAQERFMTERNRRQEQIQRSLVYSTKWDFEKIRGEIREYEGVADPTATFDRLRAEVGGFPDATAWDLVQQVAHVLLREGSIDRARFKSLVGGP